MARFFFYGTLLDDAVRRAVVGEGAAAMRAVLPGYRRVRVAGKAYPTLVADRQGKVAGLLCTTDHPDALAKIRDYEGEGYAVLACDVVTATGEVVGASVFVTRPGVLVTDVAEGSAAEDAGIQPNDIIEEVGGN